MYGTSWLKASPVALTKNAVSGSGSATQVSMYFIVSQVGGSDRVEENHRHYHSLVRLIKKEIGDKQSQSMKYLRQLLPFPKQMDEVKTAF
jgi:hypothetical protein